MAVEVAGRKGIASTGNDPSGAGGICRLSVPTRGCCCLCFGEVSRVWLVMDLSDALASGVRLNGRGYPKDLGLGHSNPVVELEVKLCNLVFVMHASAVTCRAL